MDDADQNHVKYHLFAALLTHKLESKRVRLEYEEAAERVEALTGKTESRLTSALSFASAGVGRPGRPGPHAGPAY